MIIGIAGPYSSHTEEGRRANLNKLNEVAARVLEMGHIPLIGVNAALPIIQQAQVNNNYNTIMDISMAVISACEAILVIGESKGANRERDYIMAKGLPVYYSLDEIPAP